MSYAEGVRVMSPGLKFVFSSLGLGGRFILSLELLLDLDVCLSLRLSLDCLATVLSLMVLMALLVGDPIGASL